MVVGTLSWCKKVKPVDSVDAVTQWTQYTVDAVRSGIVVYGGGDIIFDTKKVKTVEAVCSGRSMQWMQWNSGI